MASEPSRDAILRLAKEGQLVVGGWALEARPQVPGYLGACQQLLRCLAACCSDIKLSLIHISEPTRLALI
eukprot:5836020-Alexandrium_andersonii.AAC.1